jgi:hypothetical protein
MAVYVDDALIPAEVRNGPTRHNSRWSHLMADTLEELHAFARQLGMRPEWFQDHPRHPHYDLTEGKRYRALHLGARSIDHRELPEALAHKTPAPRLLFTASRDGITEADVAAALRPKFAPDKILVAGGARGGDTHAARLWRRWGGRVEELEVTPGEWSSSRGAGLDRNSRMVDMIKVSGGQCLALVARCARPRCPRREPHGSHGASHCAQLARDAGIPVDWRKIGPSADTEPEHALSPAEAEGDIGRVIEALRQAGMTKQGRQTLDEQTAARLVAAGITPDDPGLAGIAEWNRALSAKQRQQDAEPTG